MEHILDISDGENGSHSFYYCQDVSSVQERTSVFESTTSGQGGKFCGNGCLFLLVVHVETRLARENWECLDPTSVKMKPAVTSSGMPRK